MGSEICTGSPKSGWVWGRAGEHCNSVCANNLLATARATTTVCDAPRMSAVSTSTKLARINEKAIVAERGAGAAESCATYSTSTSSYAPHHSGTSCYTQTNVGATCGASSSSRTRLCCCITAVDDAATLCPVAPTDCGGGTVWLDDLASCTHTAQPTTAPTPAPTSALRECFETQTTTEYIFHEYDRQREHAIVVTPNTAPMCFSGASSAHAVTIACNVVDAPTRVRVTPARIKLFASDLSRTASFALTPVPDATNDAIRVAFAVDCKVEETPSRGIITFRGNVLPVQQLSIEGFCVEHAARRCTSGNNGLITKSIASSGLNPISLA